MERVQREYSGCEPSDSGVKGFRRRCSEHRGDRGQCWLRPSSGVRQGRVGFACAQAHVQSEASGSSSFASFSASRDADTGRLTLGARPKKRGDRRGHPRRARPPLHIGTRHRRRRVRRLRSLLRHHPATRSRRLTVRPLRVTTSRMPRTATARPTKGQPLRLPRPPIASRSTLGCSGHLERS
jgi:hypothetical protein